MAVLSDEGQTCSDPLCKLRDFLPFQCDKCHKVFCGEHYLPKSHDCPRATVGDRKVVICPACLEVVHVICSETEDQTLLRHRPRCKPELRKEREAARKGVTCPVKGCHERLTDITKYRCRQCNVDVCLKHRLTEDHKCEDLRRERRSNSYMRSLSAAATSAFRVKKAGSGSSKDAPHSNKKPGLCSIM